MNTASRRADRRQPRRTLPATAAVLLITLASLAAYSNSFDGIFVLDDEPAIERNVHVQRVWPLTESMSAPKDSTLAGRPVASLSFALDYSLAGGHSPSRYHTTNLAIHIAAALLLFGVVRRTLATDRLRPYVASAATPLATAVALLWVLHPVQTSAVTYIVQRVESLMGLWYLGTLYCAIRALDGARAMPWGIASVGCCALGMGTKEVMATAPLMVVLWDWTFAPDRIRGRRPLYIALASSWLILGVLIAGGPRSFSVGFGFQDWPWWRYLFTQAGVVVHYLRLAIAPWPLVLDYEWPASDLAAAVAPGLLIVALVAGTAWAVVRRSPLGVLGAWFFVILAPTSSVLPIITEVAAEHRLYLPLAAPVAAVVLGVFALARRYAAGRGLAVVGYAGVAALAVTFGGLTYARNADYANYDRIWSQTIAERPRNTRALNNYATSLMAQRRFDEAERHLRLAVEEKPAFAEAQANLGVSLCAQGKCAEGIPRLRRAIELKPDYAGAYRNLAEAFGAQGQMADALDNYTRALALLPDDVGLLNRAAWILATTRDERLRNGARARECAERAVRLTGRRDAVSLDSLAASLAELGDFAGASAVAAEALNAARVSGNAGMLPELQDRLELYRRGQKFRDAA